MPSRCHERPCSRNRIVGQKLCFLDLDLALQSIEERVQKRVVRYQCGDEVAGGVKLTKLR
jgi:hypothetical protein